MPASKSKSSSFPPLSCGSRIEVLFNEDRKWYACVVDEVSAAGDYHLTFEDGDEGWYAAEDGSTVRQKLDGDKFTRKQQYRSAEAVPKPTKKRALEEAAAAADQEPDDPEPEPAASSSGRPSRRAAAAGTKAMQARLQELDQDSMDGLSSENDDEAGGQRAPVQEVRLAPPAHSTHARRLRLAPERFVAVRTPRVPPRAPPSPPATTTF